MDFAAQVKGSVDIANVIGEHVRLRRSGPHRYMGLCPFHQEKTPSFTVHITHQFYKCFSCGAAGDVFKFVMEIEGLTFPEALKTIAERNGIPIPKRSYYADDEAKLRGSILAIHDVAQEHFRANLQSPGGEAARAYLAKRGLSRETIELFGLGYSDRSGRALQRLLEQRNFSAPQMEQSGLIGRREDGSTYDRFRNRLMFPIHDESGRIIGYGGRALSADDNPKYLNSPETPIYKKSQVLYNLHRAKEGMRKQDRAILVEGYMDAIGVTAAGFLPVIASCGTALTADHVKLIKKHTTHALLNFDPDTAGVNAAQRSIDILLAEGMQVRIVELDGELDPDEYCNERGAVAYQERLDGAKGYFYWLADRARAKFDVRTSEGQVSVLKFLLPSVQKISDQMERVVIANDLAGYIGVDRGMVLDTFKKAVVERKEPKFESVATLRHDERILINALLTRPDIAAVALPELRAMESVATFPSRRILEAIFALEAAGAPLSFDSVHARLEREDQNLLAVAALIEDTDVNEDEIAAAMGSARRTEGEFRRADLKRRVKELARAGDMNEALRLTAELQSLEREARGRA